MAFLLYGEGDHKTSGFWGSLLSDKPTIRVKSTGPKSCLFHAQSIIGVYVLNISGMIVVFVESPLSYYPQSDLSTISKISKRIIIFNPCWLVVSTPLKNGKDDIPYMKWKAKVMFETTNQIL